MKISNHFIKASNDLCDFDNHVPAPYIRKKFSLDFQPTNAEITICGLGFYELYINGVQVTKGPLAPYISNPDDVCYYDNYKIHHLLQKGDNVIGIILGNGFRNAFGGLVWDFDKAPCRGVPTVALCLEAFCRGDYFTLEADTSFKVHPSPVLFDDLRMGCQYDARKEITDWNMPDYDDSGWKNALPETTPKGLAKLCEADPIVVTDTIYATEITHHEQFPYCYESSAVGAAPMQSSIIKDVYIYDFGINGAGVTKLKI